MVYLGTSIGIWLVIGILVFASSFELVAAQNVACNLLPNGCGDPGNALQVIFTSAGEIMLEVLAGVAMYFIVLGCVLMMVSMGDESKFTKGRNAVVYALTGLFLALSAQMFIFHFSSIDPGDSLPTAMVDLIKGFIAITDVIFYVMLVVAGFRFVLARGKSDQIETARRQLLHVVVGMIILNLGKALMTSVLSFFSS